MIFCIRHSYAVNKKHQWPKVTPIIMRLQLVILLIIAATFKVAATAYGQVITLKLDKAPIAQVFKAIEQQSDYIFWYDKKELNTQLKVSLDLKQANLKAALDACFKQIPYSYEIISNTIVVKPKKEEKKENLQRQNITGKVIDNNGQPLSGATVRVKGSGQTAVTNEQGIFVLKDVADDAIIQIAFIGYQVKEIAARDISINRDIRMIPDVSVLQEVAVVSTGYQDIPKERATGSFVQIGKELVDRRVSTDVLSRLEGIANGLFFNRSSRRDVTVSIRGRSTIFANDQPLIVLDNFPFDGDINNINPNDVASITVLRDAAAASIWGVRAGNGVIVINTKKGRSDSPLRIDLNSNLSIGGRPDLNYIPSISSSDFIEAEINWFNQGRYTSDENSPAKPVLSPVIETLIMRRNGSLSNEEVSRQIDQMRGYDVRADAAKSLYRTSNMQQYALNLSGGGPQYGYYISSGFDNNRFDLNGNNYKRVTLSSHTSFKPMKALDIAVGVSYANSLAENPNSGYSSIRLSNSKWLYPYARLVDDRGNPISLSRDFRTSFLQQAESNGLLNWFYNPVQEVVATDNTTAQSFIRISPSLKYNISKYLNAELRYQFENTLGSTRNLHSMDTFFTRNLINLYTQTGTGGTLTRPIPLGEILDNKESQVRGNTMRGQLNYNRTLDGRHAISALLGTEIKELVTKGNGNRLYGYNQDNLAFASVINYEMLYPSYQNVNIFGPQRIPANLFVTDRKDRFRSYFANASYTYNERYMLSLSGRIDGSNFFGATANQRNVPLWSAGVGWNVSREQFYKMGWLPSLKLRATYGFNGNLDKTVTALNTASYSTDPTTGLLNATILNPANPDLRWEKIGILNIGIDFGIKKDIVSGRIEYYNKKGRDIIGDASIDPTLGILRSNQSSYRGNVADVNGNGIDVELTSRNIDRTFKWSSNFLFSYAVDKVAKYDIQSNAYDYVRLSGDIENFVTPFEGKPVYSIYSYKWAGLDPANGDPQGYLNGAVSKNYASILTGTAPADLVYSGSARPTVFGAFRNNFSWKSISLSVNLLYKLGYVFRPSSISYNNLYASWLGHADYNKRWQQAGDEMLTNVPSMPATNNANRDNFYLNSEVLVQKGDHIRLQDIQVSYTFRKELLNKLSLSKLQVYAYMNNLGIIWRANKQHIDPDYVPYDSFNTLPLARTLALGIRAGF